MACFFGSPHIYTTDPPCSVLSGDVLSHTLQMLLLGDMYYTKSGTALAPLPTASRYDLLGFMQALIDHRLSRELYHRCKDKKLQ
jgi:hypothetical protein